MSAFFERSLVIAWRTYKLLLSPWLGVRCRFLPTCSAYAVEALKMHGTVRGSWLALKRVCRCRPLGGSGYDPPPGRTGGSWKCEA